MHASPFALDPALRSGGGAGFTIELRIYPGVRDRHRAGHEHDAHARDDAGRSPHL